VYAPAEVVVIVKETPVSSFVAVTLAFATELPAGSKT